MKASRRATVLLASAATVLWILAASLDEDALAGRRDSAKGSGHRVTQERVIDSFDRIRLDTGCDLVIDFGPETRLDLTFDDNLIDRISTNVHRGTLIIGSDLKGLDTEKGCRATITTPSLKQIVVSGAGDIRVNGFEGSRFEYTLAGAGDFEMTGTVDRLEVDLKGAGRINLRSLVAQHADVHLAGAGSIQVQARESFRGSLSGVGKIDYYGDPEDVEESVTGVGEIRPR